MTFEQIKDAIENFRAENHNHDKDEAEIVQFLNSQLKRYKGNISTDQNIVIFKAFDDSDQTVQLLLNKNFILSLKTVGKLRNAFRKTDMAQISGDFRIIRDALIAAQNSDKVRALHEQFIALGERNQAARQNVAGFSEFVRQELETLSNQPPDDDFWEGDSNPWIEFSKVIDKWLKRKENGEDVEDIEKYILKGDEENQELEKFRNPEQGEGQIHLEIPPQPYIGNPKAPIWILLMNPSYSATDIYDMVCTDNDTKKTVLSSIKSNERRWYSDDDIKKILESFFTDGSEKGLTDRQRLMNNQLKFDFSRSKFYVLDGAFHTVRSKEEIRDLNKEGVERLDGTFQGSYEWWSHYLLNQNICNRKPENVSKFFVLESFPYHSENFGTIKPWIHSESHFLFWVKMVAYALANKKILLCRGMDIAERVAKIAEKISKDYADGAKRKQIFVSTSSGSFSISTGNFISYEAKKNIDNTESKAKAKKVFVNEIGEKLKEQ